MTKPWFVVADQRVARFFTEEANKELKMHKILKNSLSNLRRRDLVRHEAGTGMKSLGGRGSAHFREAKNDPIEEASMQFAREIVHFLKKQQLQKKFTVLTIVAEPHFLGKIRSSMDMPLKNIVKKWIKKDLHKVPSVEFSSRLLSKTKRTTSSTRTF